MEENRMKLSKQRVVMLLVLAVLIGLVIITFQTPGKVADIEAYQPNVHATAWALLPPVIAIGLALITKEVYSSLFIGIITGALLYANFNLELMLQTMFFHEKGGMIFKLADSWNVGILVFLVVLGILVAVMNKAGGSAAFGDWASKRIKTRTGAQLATMGLGALIFVDDYFNCLTVGNVMRPVTDKHQVSRAKLSYIIDSTAAPVCIIAPISSWAAAVTSSVPEELEINGFTTFLKTIPYNYYALFTLIGVIFFAVTKIDFGPMKKHEMNAVNGDIYTTPERPFADAKAEEVNTKGRVIDLVLPVAVLIASCVVSMIYTGGFFDGETFIDAFANSDASAGLVMGSFVALMFTFVYYMLREVLSFSEFMECIPDDWNSGYDNVVVCCTIENQKNADKKLSVFKDLPIKHKCITAQPLLESINIEQYLDDIELVVVGGESDYNARPFDYSWVLHIREQCIGKNVSFEFRQCGTNFIKDGKECVKLFL
jgi:Na+/H+ antiporter NhaC